MRTEINKILQMKHFFTVLQSNDSHIKFNFKEPSQLLIKNIHGNWLKYNHLKSDKHNMPVYLNESVSKVENVPSIYGIVKQEVQKYDNNSTLELKSSYDSVLKKSLLNIDLIVPRQDAMQYLIQWQRYRKYWWSSISTTPSLFTTNEFKYEEKNAHVDIVAQLPSGQHPVEHLSLKADEDIKYSRLTCSMCLEDALFILLLDGLNNRSQDEYLRLHRKIAPFKISLAVDLQNQTINKSNLCKLATLLYHKLESRRISTWLPDFSLPLDLQIKEILEIGVTYTAILEEETLKFGIFKLMNSSTRLSEQVHVSDLCKYAELIFDVNRIKIY